MLKNPSHSYEDSFSESHLKMPMTDEMIEQYIQILFKSSARSQCGTAPAAEWLDFLYKYNEHENYYMLTAVQQIAIKPYCEMNQDLEMTPEEFISLVYLIRHGHQKREMSITPHASASTPVTSASSVRAKKLLDSRPRSSRILSSNRSYSYYDDRSSINHPEPISTLSQSDRIHRSGFMEEQNNEYINKLKREISSMKGQLRHYETRVSDISKEYNERTTPLQSKIEHLQIELHQQREIIDEQKHKERDKLEKITELKTIIHDLEAKNEMALKKIQKRDDENEKLREKLVSVEETQAIMHSNLELTENELFQVREIMRNHEKEKADLHMKMEQQKLQTDDLKQELEAQRSENTKLLELIDRQKFDLDEARSGLRYYSNTPTLEKKAEKEQQDTSLAQEQIEAQYLKKLEQLKDERDQLVEKLNKTELLLSKAKEDVANERMLQTTQKQNIDQLSLKYDQQLQLIDEIQSNITTASPSTNNRWFTTLSVIPWLFLLFHIYLVVLRMFVPYEYQFQPFYILQYLDEWLYKHSL